VTTPREVGLLRLVALGLVGAQGQVGAAEAVGRLLAVQAQDLPGAITSVALRTGSRDRAAVVAALDAGTVVRSWPMRGTLHLLAAADLPWLLPLAGPRMVARSAVAPPRARSGRPDPRRGVRGRAVGARRRGGAGPGRAGGGLGARRHRDHRPAGLPPPGPPGPDRTGLPGAHRPRPTGEQLVVDSASWLPAVAPLEREEALARLALRYLSGHGPATVADLARWSSLPVTEVRRGVSAVRDQLAAVEVEGVEHLMDPTTPDRLAGCRQAARQLLLLPGFDEYLLGYADRDAVLAPEHAERIVPGRNGVFRPTVVVDGQVVATWRHLPGRRGAPATVAVEHFGEPGAVDARAVEEAYARLP
jgi:hypothetical protein